MFDNELLLDSKGDTKMATFNSVRARDKSSDKVENEEDNDDDEEEGKERAVAAWLMPTCFQAVINIFQVSS